MFNGHYCLLDFAVPDSVTQLQCEHNEPLEVSLGACLPASCTEAELAQVVKCGRPPRL